MNAAELHAAALRVLGAFEALGKAHTAPDLLQARARCENAMLDLRAATRGEPMPPVPAPCAAPPALPPGVPPLSQDEMVTQWVRSMDDAHDAEQFYFLGAWRGYRAAPAGTALPEGERGSPE